MRADPKLAQIAESSARCTLARLVVDTPGLKACRSRHSPNPLISDVTSYGCGECPSLCGCLRRVCRTSDFWRLRCYGDRDVEHVEPGSELRAKHVSGLWPPWPPQARTGCKAAADQYLLVVVVVSSENAEGQIAQRHAL